MTILSTSRNQMRPSTQKSQASIPLTLLLTTHAFKELHYTHTSPYRCRRYLHPLSPPYASWRAATGLVIQSSSPAHGSLHHFATEALRYRIPGMGTCCNALFYALVPQRPSVCNLDVLTRMLSDLIHHFPFRTQQPSLHDMIEFSLEL